MGMFSKPINGFKVIADAWKRGDRLQASATSAAVATSVIGGGIAGGLALLGKIGK